MKSIYKPEDLSTNAVGFHIHLEAEQWIKALLKKYPNYNPREIVGLVGSTCDLEAARCIVDWRLNKKDENPEIAIYKAQSREDERARAEGREPRLITTVTDICD
jgi:hypothetical protein